MEHRNTDALLFFPMHAFNIYSKVKAFIFSTYTGFYKSCTTIETSLNCCFSKQAAGQKSSKNDPKTCFPSSDYEPQGYTVYPVFCSKLV